MESVADLADSRAATNVLLGDLREAHLAPAAVVRFLGRAARRSLRQAARRPSALAELTALHGVLYALAAGRRPGPRWVAASWVLAASHLGLLERRTRLTAADVLTLLRGNIPALPGGAGRACGMLAIGLDLADGRLARHQGTTSPFGDYADTFADAAFWMWLTLRHEPSRTVRAAAITAWVLPIVTVTGLALRRGAMPERLRPVLLRPAAALQAVVALRHLTRRRPASVTAGCLPTSPAPACPPPVRPARTPRGP
ncbi:CDP-alcohol phosphatidyltransferase family protein [Streptomyces sp. HNM0663]|uniref:CDP-alcohol phosphatidyltransferase family protein n=1 Tax=Streptomyces chengmaiensis TaxID=3040919 RepID=A0ABT6HZY0_9ACTN|nr:CDP-alcohol phosphatidyltransferase family protein [Streptomyces chengmaiensis]MDH2393946.1 CDP-alcohol phosphatidyltransferase family protein [Streptomyces chengmaiensis]